MAFHGQYYKGYMRTYRRQKREEAEARQKQEKLRKGGGRHDRAIDG